MQDGLQSYPQPSEVYGWLVIKSLDSAQLRATDTVQSLFSFIPFSAVFSIIISCFKAEGEKKPSCTQPARWDINKKHNNNNKKSYRASCFTAKRLEIFPPGAGGDEHFLWASDATSEWYSWCNVSHSDEAVMCWVYIPQNITSDVMRVTFTRNCKASAKFKWICFYFVPLIQRKPVKRNSS